MSITLNIAEDRRKPRQVEKGYEGQVTGVGVASTGDANLSTRASHVFAMRAPSTFIIQRSNASSPLTTRRLDKVNAGFGFYDVGKL